MQDDTLNMGLSKRTFQRDMKEIKDLFKVDIEYSRTNKGYFRPQGTENLYGLLHAIKNKFQIQFAYENFGKKK